MSKASPTATGWPDGVIARYLTVGGGVVNVRHDYTGVADSVCSGCTTTHLSYGCTGLRNPTVEQQDAAALAEARQWSQAHAERCRAMPKPVASR